MAISFPSDVTCAVVLSRPKVVTGGVIRVAVIFFIAANVYLVFTLLTIMAQPETCTRVVYPRADARPAGDVHLCTDAAI